MPIVQIPQIYLKIQRHGFPLSIYTISSRGFDIKQQNIALIWCKIPNIAPNKCLYGDLLPIKPKPPQYKA